MFGIVVSLLRVAYIDLRQLVLEYFGLHVHLAQRLAQDIAGQLVLFKRLDDLGCPVQVVVFGQPQREAVEALF